MDTGYNIKSNQRVAVIGMTGSGKSFFCQKILSHAQRLVVIDPKGYLHPTMAPEWNLTPWESGINRLEKGKDARLYIPPPEDEDEWEVWLQHIMRLRNCIIYIDELYGVGPAQGSKGLRALFTRGRQMGLGVWACFQRPRWIPRFSLSEAEWKIVFRLEMAEDRDDIAKMAFGKAAYYKLGEHGYMMKDPKGHIHIVTEGIKVVQGTPIRSQPVER